MPGSIIITSNPSRRRRRTSSRGRIVVVVASTIMMLQSLSRRFVSGWIARTNPSSAARRIIVGRTSSLIQSSRVGSTSARLLSSSSSSSSDRRRPRKQQRPNNNNNNTPYSKKKKYTVNPNASDEANAYKLAEAFDELARKEGFDDSLSYYADESTFDKLDDDGDDGGGGDFPLNDDDDKGGGRNFVLDPGSFGVADFRDNDDDNLSKKEEDDSRKSKEQYSMDERIAAAQRDMVSGRVSVPEPITDDLAHRSGVDLSVLGFRQEEDPWGDDETHRRPRVYLVMGAMECSACGADFQCSSEFRPGYLPPDKFEYQVKLGKIEEMQRLQQKAENDEEWTPEDEIEFLIQTAGKEDGGKAKQQQQQEESVAEIDITAMAEQMGIDLTVDPSKNKVICKRCHGLQHSGRVDNLLRPGWTEEPLLSQEKFRDLLRPIREKPAVIVAVVDLFDFAGSVLPELDSIAGDNPVIIAANKADLLPSKMGQLRVENWVRRELEYMGIKSLAPVGGAVQLISCKTGFGVGRMLDRARRLAEEMDCDIYVVGAANAGKSTLLNHILWKTEDSEVKDKHGKIRAGNVNKRKGAVTTSPLPGTTLKFIKVDLGGRNLFDTPGLLVPGTLTQLLTPEELKIVVPKKQVEPLTFRIQPGKAVLVGGLARIELLEPSKPFFFTFFVANDIKLHPTDAERVDELLQEHVGVMLTPPLAPGPERREQLGEFENHIVDVVGMGWKEAAADITLTGLGWVSVTGAGTARVKISVPKGIGVMLRPPLMPFDIEDSTARYTGGRAVRRTTKNKHGKGRKGVGRN